MVRFSFANAFLGNNALKFAQTAEFTHDLMSYSALKGTGAEDVVLSSYFQFMHLESAGQFLNSNGVDIFCVLFRLLIVISVEMPHTTKAPFSANI